MSAGVPSPPRARWLGAVLLAAAFTALLVLPPIGQHLVSYSGEARMALLAQDMIDRGVLFRARVEDQLYRNKPPLFPWAIALFSLPAGRVTVAAAQAPVALAAILAVGFTALLGVWLFGPRAGLWAGLVLATSAAFFSHGQQILPDMLMVAGTTAAACAFWRAMSAPRGMALAGFYAALGLAVFSKGPAGLLPLLAAAVWLLGEHGPRGLARLWSPIGLAAFTALTLIWLGPFLSAGSQSFGQTVLWGDWLSWYLGLPSPRRVALVFVDLLVGCLPWTPLVVVGLICALPARRDPAVRYALASFLVPLAVIAVSRNRQPVYLLPVYPGAALLVAWWADACGREPGPLLRRLAWLAPAGVVAALAIAPLVPDVRDSGLLQLPGIAWKGGLIAAAVLLLGFVAFAAIRRGRPALLVYGAAVLMALILTAGLRLSEQALRATQDFRVVAAALERQAGGADIRLFSASLLLPVDFYLGRQLVRMWTVDDFRSYVARPDRPLVLMDQRFWRDHAPQLPPGLQVLQTIRIQGQDLFIVRASPAG